MNEHERILAIVETKNRMPIELDPTRTALVVVDMQRLFTRASSAFVQLFERLSPGATAGYVARVENRVLPAIRRLLACFRASEAPVLYTATGSEAGDGHELASWLRAFDGLALEVLERRVWPAVGDPWWQIDEALAPRRGEPVLNKHSAGAFATTELEAQLRRRGVDTTVVVGISTDVCVATTAREAADRGFRSILVPDACTTLSEEMHRASVETFNLALGLVRSSEEITRLMTRSGDAVTERIEHLPPAVAG